MSFTFDQTFPISASGIGNWQLSSTVSYQGSKTAVSSGLFMLNLWTVMLTDVGEARFRWCWVIPASPRWQEERQACLLGVLPLPSPAFLLFPMEGAAWSQVSPEDLPLDGWILLSFRKALSQVCATPGCKVRDGLKYTNSFVVSFRKPLLIWCTIWNNLGFTLY